ncbi:MAG: glutamate 5-kinase [Planctomycetota bacterium]|jgi:glutamate 5-kinase
MNKQPEDNVTGSSGRPSIPGHARIVLKVGSAVLAARGTIQEAVIESLAKDVTEVQRGGREVIMVVSGAVAGGYTSIGCAQPPTRVVERQAAASIGQYRLMARIADAFNQHGLQAAQLLMTQEDIENRRRFLSARHTIQTLLSHNVVPVVNENDALADDESKVGDNDHLAALVSNLVSAQLLVILSSVPGLMKGGPGGEIITVVMPDDSVMDHVLPVQSDTGVGGMGVKVEAARLASRWGVPTVIASGTVPGTLPRLVSGEALGTWFEPTPDALNSRKRWIAFRHRSRGEIIVDDGARSAILDKRASLLPSGVVSVRGDFSMGARVDVCGVDNCKFAVGLVSYASREIQLMKGKRRDAFENVLGYKYVDEVIDREDMVVLRGNNGEGDS